MNEDIADGETREIETALPPHRYNPVASFFHGAHYGRNDRWAGFYRYGNLGSTAPTNQTTETQP